MDFIQEKVHELYWKDDINTWPNIHPGFSPKSKFAKHSGKRTWSIADQQS